MRKSTPFIFEDPSPRRQYDGDVHPITGQRVLRQDHAGYRAARRAISLNTPAHPCLRDRKLWPDLPPAG
jgi:hypothetical protein